MKRLLERCAALDVHEKQLAACVRILAAGGEIEELATEFGSARGQLVEWPSRAVLLDIGDGLSVDAGRAPIGGHSRARSRASLR